MSIPKKPLPRSPRAAYVCLLMALLLLALGWWASQRELALIGPGALAVRPDASQTWLAVDGEIWAFDATGRRVSRVRLADLGLEGGVYSLDWHPAGWLALRLDDDPTLQLLEPATLKPAGRITLQWPDELRSHAARAVHLAFAEDGRIAASTGGGHAVALFGRDGTFIARTPLGQYRFTNGLWWSGEALWTTDTNGLQLKRLDGHTLALQQSVELPSVRDARFLGLARAHPAVADPVLPPPWATVIRFGRGRIVGVVADILPDGHELLFASPVRLEPRDLAWRGQELLVVDGLSRSVMRWNSEHQLLAPFGDADSRRELDESAQMHDAMQWLHRGATATAAALVLAAILAVWHARRVSGSRRARAARAAIPPWRAVLASVLLPGLGQWMRGRNAAALGWFLVWSIYTLAVSVPLVWNLIGPRTDVPMEQVANVLAVQLIITAIAGLEAGR